MFLQCCLLGLTHSIDRYIVFELLKNVRMSRTFSSAMVKPSFRTGDIRDQLPTPTCNLSSRNSGYYIDRK